MLIQLQCSQSTRPILCTHKNHTKHLFPKRLVVKVVYWQKMPQDVESACSPCASLASVQTLCYTDATLNNLCVWNTLQSLNASWLIWSQRSISLSRKQEEVFLLFFSLWTFICSNVLYTSASIRLRIKFSKQLKQQCGSVRLCKCLFMKKNLSIIYIFIFLFFSVSHKSHWKKVSFHTVGETMNVSRILSTSSSLTSPAVGSNYSHTRALSSSKALLSMKTWAVRLITCILKEE